MVAVIDVPKVFDNHTRFKRNMEAIQTTVKQFEEEMIKKRQELQKRAEQLKELNPSSAQYKQLEEQLAKDGSDLQLTFQLKRKEVLEKEAKQYYEAYNEVLSVLERVCGRHNIGLVLSYDSKPIDANDLNSVARGVNRPIVYQRKLDITKIVIDELNVLVRKPGNPQR